MLHGCFNPECRAELRYLRSGRIVRAVRKDVDKMKVEHFWLCGDCHQTLDFTFAEDGTVSLVSKGGRVLEGTQVARSESLQYEPQYQSTLGPSAG